MEQGSVTACKVVVLSGGWSDERDISALSGKACQKALREAGFAQVDYIDIADDDFIQRLMTGGYDVAFVALHGRYGEDGCVQGLLEVLHIPYTFSHVLASAIGSKKDYAKLVYREAGIPTPEGVHYEPGTQLSDDEAHELAARLGMPLFVKPAGNGSSFGITRVEDLSQLAGAFELAGSEGDEILVETCIEGTEITVPVIGNENPEALPIIEIVTGADFYDLKVKYEAPELHHVIPARLPEETAALAQELAVRAHVALGCRGVSRSDFIVTSEGVPYILETNTIPGMTEQSLLPDAARHAGIEFPELCRRLIELALD